MKRIPFLAFAISAIVSPLNAQYGYSLGASPYKTLNYKLSLEADLADGVLDHSSYTSLNIFGWKPTYYVREAVYYRPSTAFTAASVVNGSPEIYAGVPASGGSRVIQGIGIRSDKGRWKPVSSLPSTDPWKYRFINAPGQVWYVDLGPEGLDIQDLNGGWPKTDATVDATGHDGGPDKGGQILPGGHGEPTAAVDMFSPLWIRSDSPTKPWTVSLDYKGEDAPSPGPSGLAARVYDQKLDYARDLVIKPSEFNWHQRQFRWTRANDMSPTDGKYLYYPTSSDRTKFAWEVNASYNGPIGDFGDLRVINYLHNEYFAINSGVVGGPVSYIGPRGNVLARFELPANPFNVFKNDAPNAATNYQSGQRFEFINAPEYVRKAGDMVISYSRKRIYFLPFSQDNINTDPESDLGSYAQVLNVSLPTSYFWNQEKLTNSAPLNLEGRTGFRMNNVTFSTCAGDGLRVVQTQLQSGTPSTGWDTYLNGCTFTACGTAGLVTRNTPAMKVVNSSFNFNEGRAYVYWQDTDPYSAADTYEDYRVQNNKGNALIGNTFSANGRLHPSVPNLAIYHKPSQFWIKDNMFLDLPATSVVFFGSRTYVHGNLFTRCGTDVAEVGTVYTGRSLSNFGSIIHDNDFVDCVKGSEWGKDIGEFPSDQFCPFDQNLAGVMLDDAASGVSVSFNDFSQSENLYGPGPKSTRNVPIVINGGWYNLFHWNLFPSGSDTVFYGYQTVRDIAESGDYIRSQSIDNIAADFYPHDFGTTWKFNSTEWLTPFEMFGAFNTWPGSGYYGADWERTGTQVPYTFNAVLVNGQTVNVPWLRKDHWFDDAARKAKWFVAESGSTTDYFLNIRGNRVHYNVPLNGSSLPSRIEGHIADTTTFPDAMLFLTQNGIGPYPVPPTPVH